MTGKIRGLAVTALMLALVMGTIYNLDAPLPLPPQEQMSLSAAGAQWYMDSVLRQTNKLDRLDKAEEITTAKTEELPVEPAAPRTIASRTGTREAKEQTAELPVKETPTPAEEPAVQLAEPAAAQTERSVTYTTHTVVRGETFWNVSIKYGIPMHELLSVNKMTEKTPLNIGMEQKIPIHHVPTKETPGPQFGELVDWWTEAQYLWPIGKDARIVDFQTGKSFMVRRTVGAFHADVEPLTSADTQVMHEIWSGWSWATRPVIVEVDGRRLAASSNGMPHSIQTIRNNGFNGHFCIHFLNSTRHKDNLQQANHQRNVKTAAGQ